MFATSNNDKNIRNRALHDGKLLTKIQTAEIISSLFFCLNDNFLIATSVKDIFIFISYLKIMLIILLKITI